MPLKFVKRDPKSNKYLCACVGKSHCYSAGVGYENLVSNPKIILSFPTRLPQKSRAPGFEARKLAAQVGGEISDTIYLHLRPAVYVRNLDLKHKHLAKFCPSDWR